MTAWRSQLGDWTSKLTRRQPGAAPSPKGVDDKPNPCSTGLLDRIEAANRSTAGRIEELHRDSWQAAQLRHQHIVALLEQQHRDDWDDRRQLHRDTGSTGSAPDHSLDLLGVERRLTALELLVGHLDQTLADGITVTRCDLQTLRLEIAKASDAQTPLQPLSTSSPAESDTYEVRTWDIVGVLQRLSGAQTFAQLVTPTTSPLMAGRLELRRFLSAMTLTYASATQQAELNASDSIPLLPDMVAWLEGHRFEADIMFVDPWHSYDDSITTLRIALDVVRRTGGYVVVHDCNPANVSDIAVLPTKGECWCGATWRAFVDLANSLPPLWRWWVVDTDLGVGVIEVPRASGTAASTPIEIRPMVPAFSSIHDEWAWLESHRLSAMRLVSYSSWLTDVDI